MILATAKIEEFDRFWNTFSTKGAERKQHGSKGRTSFGIPMRRRVWVVFDWDEGLAELRLRSRGPGDLSGRRATRQAQGGGARRRATPSTRPSLRSSSSARSST